MMLATTLTSAAVYSNYWGIKMDVKWSTVNCLVTKETNVSDSSHTADHCRHQMNSQWSTAENMMTLGTTVGVSNHTVDYCRGCDDAGDYFDICCRYSKLLGCKKDVHWSTVSGLVTNRTTLSKSSPTVDHCRLQMNSEWSTAQNLMTLGTSVNESRHTLDHCRLQINASHLLWTT